MCLICRKLRIWSHLLKKSLMEKFNFFVQYLCVSIITSALFYLSQYLPLSKSLVHPPSIHILFDGCSEEVRGAKYTMS